MSTKIKLRTKVMARSRRALTFLLTTNNLPSGAIPKRSLKQQGFTLIELLVVVSILAALAGLTSVAMDGYQQDSEEKLTRVEMQRISNAIRRFKADTGYWPKTEKNLPTENYTKEDKASFSFLFNKPDHILAWDVEYAIGWHGPYIDLPAIKTVIVDSLNPSKGCTDGLASPDGFLTQTQLNAIATSSDRMNGLIDRFQHVRKDNSGDVKASSSEYCVLTRDDKSPTKFKVAEYSGSPYLYRIDYPQNSYCSSANKCIALQSFGPNGIDESDEDSLTTAQKEKIDDIVFILKLNES